MLFCRDVAKYVHTNVRLLIACLRVRIFYRVPSSLVSVGNAAFVYKQTRNLLLFKANSQSPGIAVTFQSDVPKCPLAYS